MAGAVLIQRQIPTLLSQSDPRWVLQSLSMEAVPASSPTLFLSLLVLSRTKAADCNQAGNLYILALRNISR